MYLIKIKLGYSPFSIQKLVEGIPLQGKQQIKFCKLVFTGPHSLNTALNFEKLVLSANNQEGSREEHDASYPDFNH